MQLTLALHALLLIGIFPFLVVAIPSFTSPSVMTFCKCICFSNSTILPLYLPKDPLHPCLTCTRQFCLDQKLPACLGAKTGEEDLDTSKGEDGDVEARCFQRDSPKSHVLVVLFIIITLVLLVAAVLKQNGIDLAELWGRGGISRIVSEFLQLVRNRSSGELRGNGRRAPRYASVPI